MNGMISITPAQPGAQQRNPTIPHTRFEHRARWNLRPATGIPQLPELCQDLLPGQIERPPRELIGEEATEGGGVETPLQLARLRELGCDKGQGYLFGRPRPAGITEHELADA